jgi:hypothetical protein
MVRAPSWSSLRALGGSRLLKSSYFWIVFVPIAARALVQISPKFNVELGQRAFTIDLRLPFSWEIFFYGALFTSVANMCYAIACPAIVKDFASYKDFADQGRGPNQLREMFTELLMSIYTRFNLSDLQSVLREYVTSYAGHSEEIDQLLGKVGTDRHVAIRVAEQAEITERTLPGAFWFVRDLADNTRPPWRWCCLVAYTMGLAFFAYVLLENIMFVVRYSVLHHWTG